MNSKTKELFYKDMYLSTFTATVLSSEKSKKGYETVLDQTLFYPEGGGQYGDTGYINHIEVIDTYIVGNEIVHLTSSQLSVGSTVEGVINFKKRYQNMQSHAGEHIISGIIKKLFGYNNVGFHMNDDVVIVDYDGFITEKDIMKVEEECNKVITLNLPIIEHIFPSYNECTFEYRSKKKIDGQIRVIEIPGIDKCACCGTHTKSCSEIGLIHFIDRIKYKSGVRLTVVIGNNAYKYLEKIEHIIKNLKFKLSSNLETLESDVSALIDSNNNLRFELNESKKEIALSKISNVKDYKNILYLADCKLSMDNMLFLANKINLIDHEFLLLENNGQILIKSKNDINNLIYYFKKNRYVLGGGNSHIMRGKLNTTLEFLISELSNINLMGEL